MPERLHRLAAYPHAVQGIDSKRARLDASRAAALSHSTGLPA